MTVRIICSTYWKWLSILEDGVCPFKLFDKVLTFHADTSQILAECIGTVIRHLVVGVEPMPLERCHQPFQVHGPIRSYSIWLSSGTNLNVFLRNLEILHKSRTSFGLYQILSELPMVRLNQGE